MKKMSSAASFIFKFGAPNFWGPEFFGASSNAPFFRGPEFFGVFNKSVVFVAFISLDSRVNTN